MESPRRGCDRQQARERLDHEQQRRAGLLAKAKSVVGYFQVVMLMPRVYDVHLPDWYERLVQTFHVFNLDWASVFGLPSSCFGGLAAQVAVEIFHAQLLAPVGP